MWNDRYNRLIEGDQFHGNDHLRDTMPYMQWYIQHIIRYITPQPLSKLGNDVSSFSNTF